MIRHFISFSVSDTTELTQIHLAIIEMMEETGHCITFTPKTYQNDFIFITGRTPGYVHSIIYRFLELKIVKSSFKSRKVIQKKEHVPYFKVSATLA